MVRIASGAPRRSAGSTRAPRQRTPKWRCGPVARPVLPTAPTRSPRRTAVALGHVHAAHVHVHRDERVPVVDEDRVAAEELVGHHHHRPVGGGEDGCAGVHGVVGPPVRAAGAPVDDAAVAEATARGQRVEGLPEREGEQARALPGPQPRHLAVLAVHPLEVLRRELDHVARQGEPLDRVVERPHANGGRLPPSAPAARELERPRPAEQVDGKVAGAAERLEAPGPELAPLDALPRPADERPRADRGRGLRPGGERGRPEGDRHGESRERPPPARAQRGPVRRLTSRSRPTRTRTRMTSAAPVPACDRRNSTRAPTTAPRTRTEAEQAPPRRDVAPPVGAEDDGQEQDGPGGGPGGRGPAHAAQALQHRVPSRSDLADRHPADRVVAAVGQVGRDHRDEQHQDTDHRKQNPAHGPELRTHRFLLGAAPGAGPPALRA